VATDIGGTFTDTVLADDNGVCATAKTLTTHDNPTTGALDGVRCVLETAGRRLPDVTGFVHGTTLATNALIERRGARVASITTEGFRDILDIGYERRYAQYDLNLDKPDLIVSRARSLTIGERIDARGTVLRPLDEAALPALLAALDAMQIEAVAICLLHAYANPIHECRLRDLLTEARPDLCVSVSSEISPEAREFDRLCTTVANAYIQPLMSRYLADFAQQFSDAGLACRPLLMTASGGMTTIETARRFPIRLVESGPAGGAILAALLAGAASEPRILSFDMGGTTAKLCLIDDAIPQTSRHFEIARAARFVKGSGMPVRIPVIDMIEIGAGGGSIAGIDRLGRITVGPQSAGSTPGPAGFDRGGTRATVTDADLTLGLLDPEGFAEARLTLAPDKAAAAIADDIARPLGIATDRAAMAISEIVDEAMASAARMHAVESGKNLGNRTMIAFGGNGPLHATRVARRAGVKRIIIPTNPSVGSAIGFLSAPVSFELVQSHYTTLDAPDLAAINTMFASMIDTARGVVVIGAPDGPFTSARSAFMRYRGQGHEVEIALPDRPLAAGDIPDLVTAFETAYRGQFARAVPGMRIECLNWAVTLRGPLGKADPLPDAPPVPAPQPIGQRRIICDVEHCAVDADVHDRAALAPGMTLKGPALVTEAQTTTLLSRDFVLRVDAAGQLCLTRQPIEGNTP